ncbi:hypothetical protein J3U21_00430 [Gilliamella sp. B2776]|uniref:hypothetical protein n=1 Tax=unclassified Gilliamella TaxID=2685620 RepID=UPI002269F095|nr:MULTISPECIES: hypothetical protein [unclassified Gilliamella]MCX8648802.1 hypothetical protein [Gilliamella sp. B2779]MCX8653322.1 hypothetical protein [Gilliamella sp. B2737]MCX8655598.1 hypothetical protein [Gilliamella sp. B2894]MCX8664348.1 hypothetical protein [Gilliamella sp. B2887]MCX8690614.1 hypothetical protein [Gilliamella sp. B2776]
MKNLTIKKIAFGLLLAGYASSSAFATLHATTNEVIQGNAPVLSKINGDTVEHTVTVTFTTDAAGTTSIGNNDNVKVGDYLKISYNVLDKDGDADNGNIKDTLTVYVRAKKDDGSFNDWKAIAAKDLKGLSFTAAANVNGVQSGSIIFEIDDQFAGADQIGFKLQERTEFGLPNSNKWISVSDVWSSANPVVGGEEPDSLPDTSVGPGEPTIGKGPIVSSTFKVGIFKYDATDKLDTTVNYAKAGATNPKYGDKFGAVVWNDADKNDNIDSGELVKTSAYTYQWKLIGDYQSTAAVDEVLASDTTTAEGDTIYLGSKSANNNSIYNTNYKAGAQGYKLFVETKQ